MKAIIWSLTALISMNVFALDDCLRYMSNRDRAEIVMKRQCDVIIKDSSNKKIARIDACFTKIEKQFRGKTSYGLVADLIHADSKKSSGLIVINTVDAVENRKNISIDLLAASPELFMLYDTKLVFDKETERLSIKRKERSFITRWKEKYDFSVQCR